MVECKRNLSENKKVVIFDVDGVMTTGQFLYSSNGKEYKIFGPHDNDGIKMIRGIVEILFVTADKRGYPITERRIVDERGQKLCLVSEDERYDFIEARYGMSNVVYMGDGYYDAKILKSCFFGIVPNNARVEAKESADYITPSNSGEGAVLDACLKIRELLCI